MDDLAVLVQYRQWQEWRNLTSSTRTTTRTLLTAWVGFLGGTGVRTANRQHVETFLTGRRLSPRSRYAYLSRLATFYAWAMREGHADHDPTVNIARPKYRNGIPRPITDEQLACALRAANLRTAAMISLGAYGGLRCAEIAGVSHDDLILAHDPAALVVAHAKGGTERVVPLHPVVTHALAMYGQRTGWVFPHWRDHHRPVSPQTVSERIGRHFRELGIRASAHQLRHWYATNIYRLSKDVRLTQNLLGHRSPATTAIYTQLSPFEAARAVAKLPTPA